MARLRPAAVGLLCLACTASEAPQSRDSLSALARQQLEQRLAQETRRFAAEAAARERLELDLHEDLSALRQRLLRSQRRTWAAAPVEELRKQVVLSRWPDGEAFLAQALKPGSLTAIGMILTGVQNLYSTFKGDWDDLEESLVTLEKELVSQNHQMAVNLEIVLKQAAVLLGLLSGLPNFGACLQQALQESREARPEDERYTKVVQQFLQDGAGVEAVRLRASTFAGESFDPQGSLGLKLKQLLTTSGEMRQILIQSELSQEISTDWCVGIRDSWSVSGPDPCELLVRSFDTLEGWLLDWLDNGMPQKVFRQLQRKQFAAAPNISRIETLSHLLHRSAELCSGELHAQPAPDEELRQTLQKVASLDVEEVEKEHDLLADAVVSQFGPTEGRHAVDAAAALSQPGLHGLVRRSLSAQWVFEMSLLAVATWGDRAKRRGNGLQNRLALVKSSFENLHGQLRRLPSFRRLAFEEIHSAQWWGRSGGGSTRQNTAEIAKKLLNFLATARTGGVDSLLDVGCGWGEWVPDVLQAGLRSGLLRPSFRYLGLDIAWQPIRHLQAMHRGSRLDFQVADGVEDALPQGFSVAMVRHVFQHLNLKDAWSLLKNLWRARPDFVVLSSWPDSENEDLEHFGGSSAYAAMEPASLRKFKSYDLRKPPFSLPEPMDSWPEVHQNARMLAFPGEVLRKFA